MVIVLFTFATYAYIPFGATAIYVGTVMLVVKGLLIERFSKMPN